MDSDTMTVPAGLVKAICELRQHLSTQGEFSICRTDMTPISLAEALMLGSIMRRIDETLPVQPEAVQA